MRAERVPDSECQARRAERRGQQLKRATPGRARERQPETRRERNHRERRAGGEDPEGGNGEWAALDRGQQQQADAGGPTHAVHEADPVGLQTGSGRPVRMPPPAAVEATAPTGQEQE